MGRDRDNIESTNPEETREIGTDIKGNRNVYTGRGGKTAENEFPMDKDTRNERDRDKDPHSIPPGWERTKQFLDPGSHSEDDE